MAQRNCHRIDLRGCEEATWKIWVLCTPLKAPLRTSSARWERISRRWVMCSLVYLDEFVYRSCFIVDCPSKRYFCFVMLITGLDISQNIFVIVRVDFNKVLSQWGIISHKQWLFSNFDAVTSRHSDVTVADTQLPWRFPASGSAVRVLKGGRSTLSFPARVIPRVPLSLPSLSAKGMRNYSSWVSIG